MRSNQLGIMAAMAMLAGPGLMSVTGPAMAIEARPMPRVRKRPAQTNAVRPSPPTDGIDNASVNTRQVRRQRERLAAKGRTDAPPSRYANFGRSKYMPHIGAKERGRYAA